VGAGLVAGPALLTTFEGLSDQETHRTAGLFNVCRSIPVFMVSGVLAVVLTQRTDVHFDNMRQTVQHNQPAVAETLRTTMSHFIERGYPAGTAARQASATLGVRTRASARASAVRDVLLMLALAPAVGLALVLIVPIGETRPLSQRLPSRA
jgi:hypothetical protein